MQDREVLVYLCHLLELRRHLTGDFVKLAKTEVLEPTEKL